MSSFTKKIVSKIYHIYNIFIYIDEAFKLLFEGKKDFYIKKNRNEPPELEELRINNLAKTYRLDRIYYGLDNHNIFKRKDRYKYKKILITFFGTLVLFNLFEIIFDIVMLNYKSQTGDFSN